MFFLLLGTDELYSDNVIFIVSTRSEISRDFPRSVTEAGVKLRVQRCFKSLDFLIQLDNFSLSYSLHFFHINVPSNDTFYT